MDECHVVFRGSVNGLTIVMREEDSFEDILSVIEKKIASAGKFFKGAILDVKYRGKSLSKEQEEKLFNFMVEKSGAKIKSLQEEKIDTTEEQPEELPDGKVKLKVKNFFFKGIDEGITKFYKGTVRSGQLIEFKGNVVVIGDVNPGGVIEAAGNVIVMGTLRGVVHAGCDGNREAVVVALNLQPTQLRIADLITRAPDDAVVRTEFIPEIAFIRDDTVYIERYL